jgi:VanZ family protein
MALDLRVSLQRPDGRGRVKAILGGLCFIVSCVLFFAALWPFNFLPRNRVNWLQGENGLHFDGDAIVESSRVFDSDHSGEMAFCSLEILLEPAVSSVKSSETILAFYAPNIPTGFRLLQYHDEFLIQRDFRTRQNQLDTAEIKVIQAFRNPGRKLFTITSNTRGTVVYEDGKFAESNSRFGMTCESLSGQLIIGNSPTAYDSWRGAVFGLAFFRRGLTSEEITRRLEAWRHGPSADLYTDGLLGLYAFSAQQGGTIHANSGELPDLYIPKTFAIPFKGFLTPPWKEFSPTLEYLWDVFVNITGFLPFGFFFCAYFNCRYSWRRAALLTLALGALVSLSFEVLQGLLPTRNSGLTDIITNTLGTGLGVLLLRFKLAQKMIEKLGWYVENG